jgi:Flp pilus assembly protein TadG
MIRFFKRLCKDRRGNVLAIVAACLPLVVGASGLAVDTIQWTLWKRQLQRAADSAAIAGVYDRQSNAGSTANATAAVTHDLSINQHTWMSLKGGYPIVKYDTDCPVSGSSASMAYRVCVTVAVQQSLPFSSFFMTSAPVIQASATAASIPAGGDPCMDATETGTATGLTFSGNASIEAPDCDGFSNSVGTNVSVAKGSSAVKLNTIGGVGGIQESNNFTVNAYRPYSPPIPDPFAQVTPSPGQMNCTTATLDQNTDVSALPSGTNCFGSLRVNSNQSLDLTSLARSVPDGTIYINGGDAFIQGDLTCSGCTIVLTNDAAASPIGNFKVNASSKINITAPTSGTYKGIAIYQDRRASDCNNCNLINGNSNSVITGALYFPSRELQYNGTGTTSAVCTMFVARRITFTGNSTTSNKFKKLADCSSEGLPSGFGFRMVRLVA